MSELSASQCCRLCIQYYNLEASWTLSIQESYRIAFLEHTEMVLDSKEPVVRLKVGVPLPLFLNIIIYRP